jgi:hypothetical protein
MSGLEPEGQLFSFDVHQADINAALGRLGQANYNPLQPLRYSLVSVTAAWYRLSSHCCLHRV